MMPLWTPLARSVLWVVSWRIQTLLLIEDGKRITITCEECSVCPGYRGEFRDSDAGGYSFCAQSQLPSEGVGVGVGVGDCEHRQVLSHPTEHC